jgi:hypothetical protein
VEDGLLRVGNLNLLVDLRDARDVADRDDRLLLLLLALRLACENDRVSPGLDGETARVEPVALDLLL